MNSNVFLKEIRFHAQCCIFNTVTETGMPDDNVVTLLLAELQVFLFGLHDLWSLNIDVFSLNLVLLL